MTDALVARGMSEDELLTNAIRVATLSGWLVYHIRNSRRGVVQGHVGFPDIVLCRPPRLLFVECKRETAKTTPEQVDWLNRLTLAGAEVRVWRPSDWLAGRIEADLAR